MNEPKPERVPSEFPAHWAETVAERSEVSLLAEQERGAVRSIWPDGDAADVPSYIDDGIKYVLEERGMRLRYLPGRRLDPSRIPSLDYPLTAESVRRLEGCARPDYDPFELDGGWFLVSEAGIGLEERYRQNTRIIKMMEARRVVTHLTGLGVQERPPSAVELLYLYNFDPGMTGEEHLEMCQDPIRDGELTTAIAADFSLDQGRLRIERFKGRFPGAFRPIWKLPPADGPIA